MKNKHISSDNEILKGLRDGTFRQNRYLKIVYTDNFELIKTHVLKNSGTHEEAKDVFQEGVIVFYKNVKAGKFKGDSKISTYLFSICRFIWLKKLKRKERESPDTELPDIPDHHFEDPNKQMLDMEQNNLIMSLFKRLGDVCKQILTLTIYEDLKMEEVARMTGFKDKQNVRNKKYKCMKKLKDLIKDHPELENRLRNV